MQTRQAGQLNRELLRVPPFPGARQQSLVRAADERTPRLSEAAADAVLAAILEAKVGGSYWGKQPSLAVASYSLVRATDWKKFPQLLAEVDRTSATVCWLEGSGFRLPRHLQGIYLVTGCCDPWHLLSGAKEVIVDANDELALLATLAGVPVRCVGEGVFGKVAPGPAGRDSRCAAFRSTNLDPFRYLSPFTGKPLEPLEAVALCAFWRQLIDNNRSIVAALGFARWKRPTVSPLLWGGSGEVPFASQLSGVSSGDRVAVWRSRVSPALEQDLARRGAETVEVEDGFIRSTGLGADCVPPLSIVVDGSGVHFDPSRPSELEQLLQEGHFTPDMLARARDLRQVILDRGISKYRVGQGEAARPRGERLHVLVPGQVEDDRSVRCGGGRVSTNLELLRRARADRPEAYILYKPHPDVEAGHRIGAIPDRTCLSFADEIVRDEGITPLLEMVDEVHVITSLAGFEALLRGKKVTTHGVPFYAGWGLTRDLGAVPERRTARRTLDELVAAVLLLYPRYLDPETGLPCPPEVLIDRLSGGSRSDPGNLVKLRRLQGRWKQRLRQAAAR